MAEKPELFQRQLRQVRRDPPRPSAEGPRLPALNNKTAKVHRLVGLLEESTQGLTIAQMASSLSVDERTVKRYLAELRRLKFQLIQEERARGNAAAYRLDKTGGAPSHFLPGLKKIRAELHAGGNPKYSTLISELIRFLEQKDEAASSAAEAATAASTAGEVYYIDHGPFAEADPPPGILKIVEAAIAARTAVRITYSGYSKAASPRPESTEFLFFPYVLSLRVGTLYLIGRQGENRGPFKSLSVKRIKRCQALAQAFQPEPFNPAEYYKFTFGQWARQLDEIPETVVFSVRAPWLEKYLSESRFNPPGKILRKGKDVLFEVKMVVKPDFVNWVISLAPDLMPLRPESLRKDVAERLRKALAAQAES